MAEDVGESLVGSYLRYVEGCEFVLFNTYLPGIQGELDVIGIRLGEPRDVYFAEVTTHLDGMTYGGNAQTVAKIKSKLVRAQDFARDRFPDDHHHFSVWSPRVAVGSVTHAFDELVREFNDRGDDLSFVINVEYGDRIQRLIDVARANKRATSDPAFRLLQVLSRVRSKDGGLRL